jgi:hypothetical protein
MIHNELRKRTGPSFCIQTSLRYGCTLRSGDLSEKICEEGALKCPCMYVRYGGATIAKLKGAQFNATKGLLTLTWAMQINPSKNATSVLKVTYFIDLKSHLLRCLSTQTNMKSNLER